MLRKFIYTVEYPLKRLVFCSMQLISAATGKCFHRLKVASDKGQNLPQGQNLDCPCTLLSWRGSGDITDTQLDKTRLWAVIDKKMHHILYIMYYHAVCMKRDTQIPWCIHILPSAQWLYLPVFRQDSLTLHRMKSQHFYTCMTTPSFGHVMQTLPVSVVWSFQNLKILHCEK